MEPKSFERDLDDIPLENAIERGSGGETDKVFEGPV